MVETVDQDEINEMAKMVQEVLCRVVLEALKHLDALEGGAGPGHPVLDLDEEICMLSRERLAARGS